MTESLSGRQHQGTMSKEDVVKQGYAKVRCNTSDKTKRWKKRWMILRNEKNGYPKRLEKYADEETAKKDGKVKRIYELSEIKYVDRIKESRVKHAIQMVLNDFSTLQLACDSEFEAERWMSAIQEIKDSSSRKDIFEVYLLKSKALDGSGDCLLQVRADSICLLDIDNPQRVQLTWPLSCIRKYSTERGMFVIETGRSSPTGEGTFMFDCKCASNIYDCVQAALEAMAKEKRRAATINGKQTSHGIGAEMKYHASMSVCKTESTHDNGTPPPYDSPTPPTDKSRRAVVNKPNSCRDPQECGGLSLNNVTTTSGGPNDYDLEQDHLLTQQGQGQSASSDASVEIHVHYDVTRSGNPAKKVQSVNTAKSGDSTLESRGTSSSNQIEAEMKYHASKSACETKSTHDNGTSPPYDAPTPPTEKSRRAVANEPNSCRDPQECGGQSLNNVTTTSGEPNDYDLEQGHLTEGQEQSSHGSVERSERHAMSPSAKKVQSGNTVNSTDSTSESRGTSSSNQVYASGKDQDDKDLEFALKGAFNETGLHCSLYVDRIELEDLKHS